MKHFCGSGVTVTVLNEDHPKNLSSEHFYSVKLKLHVIGGSPPNCAQE